MGLTWVLVHRHVDPVKENPMLADIFGPDLLIVAIVLVVLLFGGAALFFSLAMFGAACRAPGPERAAAKQRDG